MPGKINRATSLDGYMIEIADYASRAGSRKLNQKLSEERAAAVAQYLRETKDVPMRRILVPAGATGRLICSQAVPILRIVLWTAASTSMLHANQFDMPSGRTIGIRARPRSATMGAGSKLCSPEP